MISTKQDHQFGLTHGLSRPFPDLGIDFTATAIVDMGAEQPKRARPIDGDWLNAIGTFEVILQLLPKCSFVARVRATSQRR